MNPSEYLDAMLRTGVETRQACEQFFAKAKEQADLQADFARKHPAEFALWALKQIPPGTRLNARHPRALPKKGAAREASGGEAAR